MLQYVGRFNGHLLWQYGVLRFWVEGGVSGFGKLGAWTRLASIFDCRWMKEDVLKKHGARPVFSECGLNDPASIRMFTIISPTIFASYHHHYGSQHSITVSPIGIISITSTIIFTVLPRCI